MRTKPDFWRGNDRICWLCVLMEEFVGVKSLEYAPALMSGMASIFNAPVMERARQAVFNMRQISLAYVTLQSVKLAIALYNDYHYRNNTEGPYRIDAETLHFERTDLFEDPLITEARNILAAPITYELHSKVTADPLQPMAVALGEESTVPLPIGPIRAPLAARRTHNINRIPYGSIRIPRNELDTLAIEMDERDARHPERRSGNWKQRLDHIELKVPEAGLGLREEHTIELTSLKHLIGLPGSGKTTMLMLISVWLSRHGYKIMLIFPSIEVARQYMADLDFHGVRVGMLVGQNPETRQQHANRIAEAIAASSGQGGFAHTIEGANSFAANCVLPAFSNADTSMWGFGYAPCNHILQGSTRSGRMKECLCPVWTMCGRNKAPRDLLNADVWVGHVLSMDTTVPAHAIDEQIRYFELIARTFDVVVFDEADMVQSTLDRYGAALLKISGDEESIHRVIQGQIHDRFARGENYRLFDREIELYSRDLAEFGNHNTSLMTAVQNISHRSPRIGNRYADQLLTTSRVISELLDGFEKGFSKRDQIDDREVSSGFSRNRALSDFWDDAASAAFYNRTGVELAEWNNADLCARILGIDSDNLLEKRKTLIGHFRRYLAENLIQRRDKIVDDITNLFLKICFPNKQPPLDAEQVILLLVSITFMILGYQRIVPGTRTMVAEGLIRDPIVDPPVTLELRRYIPENLLGSLTGVKYSFSKARTTRGGARNVKLSYITFVGAPRMLMHRFHRLLEADGGKPGPAVLMTSATSFLEASPAYHINVSPHYLLKPRGAKHDPTRSIYHFMWFADRENRDEPLRYSGAGDFRERNLERMVEALVRNGINSEINKSIRLFDVKHGIRRKAALVVNSYAQARQIKQFLDRYYPDHGKHTKAVVRSLEEGEKPSDYVTSSQCEALGDDETCDIIVFPMMAIGRGVNIVFTKGDRVRDAAIGSIYFLTRPHPSTDDMQLLQSLAGRATQQFDSRTFAEDEDLTAISRAWRNAKSDIYRQARRLLQEPLMASRLGPELFKPFTANQMVAILQTIGRGMRNGCPVAVYFVDAAWAPESTKDKPDSSRDSMLVQMRLILEECVSHSDPVTREIYRELYEAFLIPLRQIKRVEYPDDLRQLEDSVYEDDAFDDFSPLLEM